MNDFQYTLHVSLLLSTLARSPCSQDFPNARDLLAPSNRDAARLKQFAEEIARVTTHDQIPQLAFAANHHGDEDIAMFDFTSMSMANHSCYVRSRDGHTLIQAIVGDTLLEVSARA